MYSSANLLVVSICSNFKVLNCNNNEWVIFMWAIRVVFKLILQQNVWILLLLEMREVKNSVFEFYLFFCMWILNILFLDPK